MYTGLITEVATVAESGDGTIAIVAPKSSGQLEVGGSFAIDGVCVTAIDVTPGLVKAMVSDETRRRSTLGELTAGRLVNVELPLRLGDVIGGHLVQGHVDAVGKVVRIADETVGRRVWIRPPERFLDEIVAKGSVAVDGVSLTVAEVVRDRFSVALLPATLEQTTLSSLSEGRRVNLEGDLAVKVARRNPERPSAALASVVGSLPWAGRLSGRVGVDKAIAQIASGGAVVLFEDVREGEGDVMFAGARLRPEAFVFLLTQACGHTTVPCDATRLDRLEIPTMPGAGDRQGTAFHTSIDLASSTGTGISAPERAATVRRLAHEDARPADLLRPGHVFPLAARAGGLRERAGHTEASVELCRAAGLPTVAVICEVMSPDGTMAGASELERFALQWGLPMVDVADLVAWL